MSSSDARASSSKANTRHFRIQVDEESDEENQSTRNSRRVGNHSDIYDETTRLLGNQDKDSNQQEYSTQGKLSHSSSFETFARFRSKIRKAPIINQRWDKKDMWLRAKYYCPILEWAPNYQRDFLLGDIIGGLTVACLLVPQSISYASGLAGISPVHGLYSAAIPLLVYALFGSCRQLSIGPEASLSLLSGNLVRSLINKDPHDMPTRIEDYTVTVISLITFEAGLVTWLMGMGRMGFVDSLLSRALLRGFISALAVVILAEQLIPMCGLTLLMPQFGIKHDSSTFAKIGFLFGQLHRTHYLTAAVAFGSLGCLIIAKILKTKVFKKNKFVHAIPEILICVIVTTVLTNHFEWDKHGLAVLGNVKSGSLIIQSPVPKDLTLIKETLGTAILIAIIGYVESIIGAKQVAAKSDYSVSNNAELRAYGLMNIAGSTFTGIPSYGSITRTRLNEGFGATTQMSGIVTAMVVFASIFFLLPLLYYLPRPVLASIICLIIWGLLWEAPEDLIFLWKISAWYDMALMTLTFFLTLGWSVAVGITVSIALSLVMVVKQQSRPRIQILGRIPHTKKFKPVEDDAAASLDNDPGALIVKIREPLTFSNVGQLKDRLRKLELYGQAKVHPSAPRKRADARVLCFHMGDVVSIDASALEILMEIVRSYQERQVYVIFAHLRPQERALFDKSGMTKLVGEQFFLPDLAEAMAFMDDHYNPVSVE